MSKKFNHLKKICDKNRRNILSKSIIEANQKFYTDFSSMTDLDRASLFIGQSMAIHVLCLFVKKIKSDIEEMKKVK